MFSPKFVKILQVKDTFMGILEVYKQKVLLFHLFSKWPGVGTHAVFNL